MITEYLKEILANSFQELTIDEINKGDKLIQCNDCEWFGNDKYINEALLVSDDGEPQAALCPLCNSEYITLKQ